MGRYLMDQFTYLHFASGIIAYFWGVTLKDWILINIAFELFENSDIGMKFISKIPMWPGSKPTSDYHLNIIGDISSIIIGWLSAYYVDNLGVKYGWYDIAPKYIINK